MPVAWVIAVAIIAEVNILRSATLRGDDPVSYEVTDLNRRGNLILTE